MKKKQSSDIYKKLAETFISALTGQTKLSVTLVVYSFLALMLLTYVSAQVYTSVLSQEISELKTQRYRCKENLSRLTGEYVALSSGTRVSQYCEDVLGMIKAGDKAVQRYAVQNAFGDFADPVEFTRVLAPLPDPYRYTARSQQQSDER